MLPFSTFNASIAIMSATVTVRQLDEETKARLRLQAARNGRSMEAEAREILRQALAKETAPHLGLVNSIRRRFSALGGVELELPERQGSIREIDLS
jgi:plasmid stability protein